MKLARVGLSSTVLMGQTALPTIGRKAKSTVAESLNCPSYTGGFVKEGKRRCSEVGRWLSIMHLGNVTVPPVVGQTKECYMLLRQHLTFVTCWRYRLHADGCHDSDDLVSADSASAEATA